jgi:hypothetical protein
MLLLIAGMRGVTGGLRIAACKRLAGMAPLGGPGNILLLLGPLLTTRVHPRNKRHRVDISHKGRTRGNKK